MLELKEVRNNGVVKCYIRHWLVDFGLNDIYTSHFDISKQMIIFC